MSNEPKQYRKKPIVIEAMRWDGVRRGNTPVVLWIRNSGGRYGYTSGPEQKLYIDTLEGDMTAEVGDYIIRGIQGEFYPCKPDIFDATYEDVEVDSIPPVDDTEWEYREWGGLVRRRKAGPWLPVDDSTKGTER